MRLPSADFESPSQYNPKTRNIFYLQALASQQLRIATALAVITKPFCLFLACSQPAGPRSP